MSNVIPILFTFDEKLVMQAGVCITSLLKSAKPDTFYDIFVIHDAKYDFSNSFIDLYKVSNNFKITFKPISGEFVGGYQIRGIPETAYYRLISPEIIVEYDKYIYSDVDVIFREDLGHYYSIPIDEYCFAGVDSSHVLKEKDKEYVKRTLGLDLSYGYFYSGNLIINARKIRESGIISEFRRLGKNQYTYQDMDIMNIACNKQFLDLGPAFCLTNYLYEALVINRGKMDAIYGSEKTGHALRYGIVHYNGPKPWNDICLNMDIWWNTYRYSLYYDEVFAYRFWMGKPSHVDRLTLLERLKLLVNYFRR